MSNPVVKAHAHRGTTQAVKGAPWIHFHHKSADQDVARGEPAVVEMVCHACRRSALVLFRYSLITINPTVVRADDVEAARERFCRAHRDCVPDPGWNWEKTCSARRDGQPEVYDFAGALS